MGLGRTVKRTLGDLFPSVVLYRGAPVNPPRVALTFDDGPHPETTSRILDAFAQGGHKATFFLQGSEAARSPALVREIHAAGHQVGNHAYSHETPRRLGRRDYVREVLETQQLLEDIVGQRLSPLFRPPYGAVSVATFASLVRRGYRFVFWSRDSGDSDIRDAQALSTRFAATPVRPGEIVLLHEDYAHTVAALPSIIGELERRSCQMVRVTDL